MATSAIRMFRRLEGLFCVYKPVGVHWKLVRDTIETNLLKGKISHHGGVTNSDSLLSKTVRNTSKYVVSRCKC